MTTSKKIANISLRVIAWLLVAFAVFMMVFTVFTVSTVDRNDRSVFGVKLYIVQTDSMSLSEKNAHMDVHFNAGDIIIVKTAENPTALQPGDVISFMSTNTVSYGETVTHMIREVKTTIDGKVIGYVTFGTNTDTNDEALVEPEYVLGVYNAKLPGVGNFFAFVRSTPGYIICVLIPFLLLILYNGVNVIRLFRRYKSEQMEEMQAERNKIEAERAENQKIMEQLLALKAQLDQQGGGLTPTVTPASEATCAQEAITETTPSEDATAAQEQPTGETSPEQAAPTQATDEN